MFNYPNPIYDQISMKNDQQVNLHINREQSKWLLYTRKQKHCYSPLLPFYKSDNQETWN